MNNKAKSKVANATCMHHRAILHVKPGSYVMSAVAFVSNINNRFHSNKWYGLHLTFALLRMGWQRSKTNANIDITCESTFSLRMNSVLCWWYHLLRSAGTTREMLFCWKSKLFTHSGVAHTVKSAYCATHLIPSLSPTNACEYVDQKGSAVVLAIKRSTTVTPKVNLRNSSRAGNKAGKQIHSDVEI